MAFAAMFGLGIVFMFFAFGLDAGLWYFDHRRAQNQADAAALAAVDVLPADNTSGSHSSVISQINTWLGYNQSSAAERTCPVDAADLADHIRAEGPFDVHNPTVQLNTVWVCVRRPSPATFAKIAGIDSMMVSAGAKARVRMVPLEYALMAMDESCSSSDKNIDVSGGAMVTLGGKGGTYTANNCGSSGASIDVTGANSFLKSTAGKNDTDNTGTNLCNPASNPTVLDPPCTIVGPIPDPYAGLTPPAAGPCIMTFDTSDGAVNPPGNYCQTSNISINAGRTVTLDCSGVPRNQCYYIFHTDTFRINNNVTLAYNPSRSGGAPDPGITLFFTCPNNPPPCTSGRAANIDWSGNDIQIGTATTPLTGNPDYKHILIWVDRLSGRTTTDIRGGANVHLAGRIYNFNADMTLNGNASETVALNLNIIANTIRFTGGNIFNLNWTDDFAPVVRSVTLVNEDPVP